MRWWLHEATNIYGDSLRPTHSHTVLDHELLDIIEHLPLFDVFEIIDPFRGDTVGKKTRHTNLFG